MKLIDLLVKKTKQEGWAWPGKSTFCYQTKPERGYITKFFDRNGVKVVDYCWEKCDDASVFNELTKEQYEDALAASDGWIDWGGGECPVHESANVDIKLEDGSEKSDVPASAFIWQHDDDVTNIIAYRLHKPDLNSRANDDRLEQYLNECIGQGVDMPEWMGGGLPPVGTICEAKVLRPITGWEWRKVKVVESGIPGAEKEALVYDLETTSPSWADEFRPLRTEAEKAREKLAASLHIAAGASPIELNGIGPLYFELADAIISGSVFGTTFKADK